MHLRKVKTEPRLDTWSDASGKRIAGYVVEHYLGGTQPISRTTFEEADAESHRLTLSWMIGLEQGGYSLHLLDNTEWPELAGHAGYVFEEPEDGMCDHPGETYMNFVGSCHPTTSAFPTEIERAEGEDPGTWVLEKIYGMGDERECPWCGPGTDNESARPDCLLCEGEGLLSEPYHVIALYRWVETPGENEDV